MSAKHQARHEQRIADNWNARHPIGTPVQVCKDDRSVIATKTRTAAQLLGGHTAVVWIEGETSCYSLRRVTPVQTPGAL